MPSMTFRVKTTGDGASGHHTTEAAEFWSVEHRMGGEPDKPNPLELFLGSLTGCMNVVLQMVAQEKGWKDVNAKYHVEGEIDPRGIIGVAEIPPYFQRINVVVRVSGLAKENLAEVQSLVGQRCPVHSLLDKAGIPVTETWEAV